MASNLKQTLKLTPKCGLKEMTRCYQLSSYQFEKDVPCKCFMENLSINFKWHSLSVQNQIEWLWPSYQVWNGILSSCLLLYPPSHLYKIGPNEEILSKRGKMINETLPWSICLIYEKCILWNPDDHTCQPHSHKVPK